MTLDELETLRNRAAKQTGDAIRLSVGARGWCLVSDGPLANIENRPITEIAERLREWATPKEPEFYPVMVPVSWLKKRLDPNATLITSAESEAMTKACMEALEKMKLELDAL